MWAGFESRFNGILKNLAYHAELADKEAAAADIAEAVRRSKVDDEKWEQQEHEWNAVSVYQRASETHWLTLYTNLRLKSRKSWLGLQRTILTQQTCSSGTFAAACQVAAIGSHNTRQRNYGWGIAQKMPFSGYAESQEQVC
jgi:hypothetical protein